MKSPVNLRVYRRTFEHLILLWNGKGINETKVNIFAQEKDGKWRPLEFVLASAVEEMLGEKVSIPDQTAMAGIVHDKNHLDPSQDCRFKIVLESRDGKPVETLIQVFKVGVLPNTEKDRKEAHMQIMGWDEQGQVWAKIPLKKINGQWALPVYIVPDQP